MKNPSELRETLASLDKEHATQEAEYRRRRRVLEEALKLVGKYSGSSEKPVLIPSTTPKRFTLMGAVKNMVPEFKGQFTVRDAEREVKSRHIEAIEYGTGAFSTCLKRLAENGTLSVVSPKSGNKPAKYENL